MISEVGVGRSGTFATGSGCLSAFRTLIREGADQVHFPDNVRQRLEPK
jgi:hypothetical protein